MPFGTSGADTFVGNTNNDTYYGLNGNDSINGRQGNDYLVGGTSEAGDQAADYDDNDSIDGGAGRDTVYGGFGNDFITDVGSDADELHGGAGEDTIKGMGGNDLLYGDAGNDNIYGGQGNDALLGGEGDDSYYIENNFGIDTIIDAVGVNTLRFDSYTQSAVNINLYLDTIFNGTAGNSISGLGNITNLVGSSQNDTLTGNDANNLLDGKGGADTLTGGIGNDTYILDNAGDVVFENSDEGTDTVIVNRNYTLGVNFENLTLTGSGNNTLTGNNVHNILTGNAGNNRLVGNGGNDTLIGGGGKDTMLGGAGNDIYTVDSVTDVVTENANEGNDTVSTTVSYTLGNHVENIQLLGANNINATGNALNNSLRNNQGNNLLMGGGGDDSYQLFNENSGRDTIDDSVGVHDVALFNTMYYHADLAAVDTDGDTFVDQLVVSFDADNQVALNHYFDNTANTAADSAAGSGMIELLEFADKTFLDFSDVQAILSSQIDLNLTGTDGPDTLTGSAGYDKFWGGKGNDSLVGLGGNDLYYFANDFGSDTVNDSTGTDTLIFSDFTSGIDLNLTNGSFSTLPIPRDTQSLLRFNATVGSDNVVDSFGNTWVSDGGAQIASADSWKTGEKYIELDNWFENLHTTDIAPTSDHFTLRWRQRMDIVSADQALLSSPNGSDQFTLIHQGLGELALTVNGVTHYGAKQDFEAGQWYDIEWSYSLDSGYKLYVDGQLDVSISDTTKMSDPGGFVFGKQADDAPEGPLYLYGGVGDVYFTNEQVLHTGNFTPLTDSYFSQLDNTLTWSGSDIENVNGTASNDRLTGNALDNALDGAEGDDTLIGGTGNDSLYGGQGNDEYRIAVGDGTDRIFDNVPGAPSIDKVVFGTSSGVAFWMHNQDLQVRYSNMASDKLDVSGQLNPGTRIERFELSNGQYLTDSEVNQVIQDLTAYANNNSMVITSVDDVKNNADLMAIVNAAWHA